ncbi:hypothetical protein [Microbulbifer sediminum]|uniref:hypothetical protein n=1 Tax=Microbulbifer sediminum TaxID=2904250 RepID=UPI001F3111F6|nr:hypothetical protein [Microbulbifer sediminum]
MKECKIDVPAEELVSRNFTVTPVAQNDQKWVITDDKGEVVDDILAEFKSLNNDGRGYGTAILKFTLEGAGWSWDFKSCGRNRIPGINFCSRPKSPRVRSEFQSYVDEEDGQVLYLELDPKRKENGAQRRYQFCWVARRNGHKYKSEDPAVVVEPS